ncbi:hypothetical protein OSTOST_02635 [Ostertagia ostertagi]
MPFCNRGRTTKRGLVIIRCTGCRKKNFINSIAVQNGCEFIGDPALLPHVCVPLKNAKDKVTRMVRAKPLRQNHNLPRRSPTNCGRSIAQFIDDNAPDEKDISLDEQRLQGQQQSSIEPRWRRERAKKKIKHEKMEFEG